MARIRSIKPELLEDERTASLGHLEFRLFVSLLLLADDYGNFRASTARVKGVALWAHLDANVEGALSELERVGLVRRYHVDGQAYGHVTGWSKHQKVDHPGKPSCPGPETVSRNPREGLGESASLSRLIGSDLKGLDRKISPPACDPSAAEQVAVAPEAIAEASVAVFAEDDDPAPVYGPPIEVPRSPRAYPLGAATHAFLECFERYPNAHGKIPAAAQWQDTAATVPGGEQGLKAAILARFDAGMLTRHPYSGEAKYRPSFEAFLKKRHWEDPDSKPDEMLAASGARAGPRDPRVGQARASDSRHKGGGTDHEF